MSDWSWLETAIDVGGSIGSAILGADASEDSADAMAESIADASAISEEAADQARQDILDTFSPAYTALTSTSSDAIDAILDGRDAGSELIQDAYTSAAETLAATGEAGTEALEGTTFAETGDYGTGLAGAQEILGNTLQESYGSLQAGYGDAATNLTDVTQYAASTLEGGPEEITTDYSLVYDQAAAGSYSLDDVNASLESGTADALTTLGETTESATGEVEGFAGQGEQAFDYASALSGALGPEAQQAAFDTYMESPGQEYITGKTMDAVTANAAATGGTYGGNVLTELQENAAGLASTYYQQDFDNLTNLAGSGLTAAGQQADITQNTGITGAGFQQESGVVGAEIAGNLEAGQMAAETDASLQNAVNSLSAASTEAGLQQTGEVSEAELQSGYDFATADIWEGLGTGLANLNVGYGEGVSDLVSESGALQAGYASEAGQDIAGVTTEVGGDVATLTSNLGTDLANLESGAATNVANLTATSGQNQSELISGLGTNLANIGLNLGTTQADYSTDSGEVASAAITGENAAYQSGITSLTDTLGAVFEAAYA